jgi:hypothetical protein
MRRVPFVAGLVLLVASIMLVVFSFVYSSLFCQGTCTLALVGLALALRTIGILLLAFAVLLTALGAFLKPVTSR